MSGLYEAGVQAIMAGDIDLVNDRISIMLVDTTRYSVDLSTDAAQSDIPDAARLSEKELTGNTLDGSTFRADDATLEAVVGSQCGAVVVLLESGEYSTSTLLAYLDGSPAFPFTPDGSDVVLEWSAGINGIFKL